MARFSTISLVCRRFKPSEMLEVVCLIVFEKSESKGSLRSADE